MRSSSKRKSLYRRAGRQLKGAMSYLAMALITIQPVYAAGALPTGATVVAGDVAINSPSASSVVVSQTSQAGIVNWSSFSIGDGNAVQFNNGAGATLNRVTGPTISAIDGTLAATGSVYLVNANGIIVGQNGVIDTGGSFVGSTLDVLDSDFLDGGDLSFQGNSKAAIVNYGKVGSVGGDVAFIAAKVDNEGSIDAQTGTAALVSGYEVLMRDASVADGKFLVKAGGSDTEVRNTGNIKAADAELRAVDGNVYALAGNTSGLINATGVSSSDGRVFLTADGGTVTVDSAVSAQKSDGSGGTIVATGHAVEVGSQAKIKADGTTGGTILLGGDQYGGQDASRKLVSFDVANASTTVVRNGAEVSANGSAGDGGNIVLWSQDYAYLGANMSATGAGSGNGGFAEVSSATTLDYQGFVDLSSENGTAGTLLLDPYSLTISTGTSSNVTGLPSGPTYTSSGSPSVLNVTTLTNQLANSNVLVNLSGAGNPNVGDITVADAVNWSSDYNLTLDAVANIFINAPITNTTSSVATLLLKADGTITDGAGGYIQIQNLDIEPHATGGKLDVTLDNSSNNVRTLTSGAPSSDHVNDLYFVNTGNLDLGPVYSTGYLQFYTSGDLTLVGNIDSQQSGGSSSHPVNSIILAMGGNFINEVGPDVLSTAGATAEWTRWLIFLPTNASYDTNLGLGGPDSGKTAIWGVSYGDFLADPTAIGAPTAGNHYVIGNNLGLLEITLDSATKAYGDAPITLDGVNILSASINTGHPAQPGAWLGETGVSTPIDPGNFGDINVSSVGNTLNANAGLYDILADYTVASGPNTGIYTNILVNGFEVTPVDLTVTAYDDSKYYDAVAYSGGNGV